MQLVQGVEVEGITIDSQARCDHYHSRLDIIAIKFKCCGKWFPCYECHTELAEHEPQIWARNEFKTKAILCGVCGQQLTIDEYLNCDSICPNCSSQFNPGCAKHYDLYFEV